MAESEAKKRFDQVVQEIQENPFESRHEALASLMDAALDVWNEDIAGTIELADGSAVTIQPIIHKDYYKENPDG